MFSCLEETLRQNGRRTFLACWSGGEPKKNRPLQRKTMPSALQSDGIVLVFNIRLDGADSKQNKGRFFSSYVCLSQPSRKCRLISLDSCYAGWHLPPESWRTSNAMLPLTQSSYFRPKPWTVCFITGFCHNEWTWAGITLVTTVTSDLHSLQLLAFSSVTRKKIHMVSI